MTRRPARPYVRTGRMNRSRWIAAGTSVGALVAVTAGVAAANPAPSATNSSNAAVNSGGANPATPSPTVAPQPSEPRGDGWGYPEPDSGSVDPNSGSYTDPNRGAYVDPNSGSYSDPYASSGPPAYDPSYDGGGNTSSGGS